MRFRFLSPEVLPLHFILDGCAYRGLSAEFTPSCETRRIDATMQQTIVIGHMDGLEIRVECTEYLDSDAIEYLAFFTNNGENDTPLISDVRIFDGILPCNGNTLVHGNGDTCHDNGYEWQRETIEAPIRLETKDGTSCNGAFPYMRFLGENCGVNIAIGWPAMWRAEFEPAGNGVHVCIGQKRCNTILHPGETLRTPRVNLQFYTGDEFSGINAWRRWYLAHILPRENGQPLPPKCCMHVFGAEGKPEFTGASEENQLRGLAAYLAKDIHPDVWWIDAGWYPCNYEWDVTGTWVIDEKRFPNGLAPIGEECARNDIRLLLWFEPERVRPDTQLDTEHPEWLLQRKMEDGSIAPNRLLNLGNCECCDWVIDRLDSIIKASGVKIYRQDFNFSPAAYWEQAEAENRIGMLENLHVQGYLRLWDTLLYRNPGLWIDSCASGGRRNDLETMRRAVPLHYTDVGYGNHPVKQKQHRQMFEWIPYFRAHNMNWYNPETNDYDTIGRPADRFSYHAAMTPALTEMLEWDADDEACALARKMLPIWRRAAQLMLSGDYYPLTECRKSQEDFYAMQFHDPSADKGFVQIMRNNRCAEESFCAQLHALNANAIYSLTEAETGETSEFSGKELTSGIAISLPIRTGRIYFYERKR